MAKTEITQETYLIGIGASPGIAIGATFLLNRARAAAVERRLAAEEIAGECARFLAAVALSKLQLEEVKAHVADPLLAEHLYIIDTHLLILDDQMLHEQTLQAIEKELLNAEGALKRTLQKFRAVFDCIEDEYLRERRSDIDSVGDRLLRNLVGARQQSPAEVDHKAIIVAHDLSPADTMQLDKSKVIAFVTDVGGRTSHTAILARSLGIPAVVGLETVSTLIPAGLPVIVDGSSGLVILNPSAAVFREYLGKKQAYEYFENELLAYRSLAAQTLDGVSITLRGNVELVDDVSGVLQQGAAGIGLLRTEYAFMNRLTPPDEEEQLGAYRRIIQAVAPHPVTIRTLDVGGDKFVPEMNLSDEVNPALGLRGIRFSLKERRLFHTQLRAVLRASAYGQVRLMFPMISGLAEVRACREALESAKAELLVEGIAFDSELSVGVMIETPAAALLASTLAAEVDFFSIGTNDLIQYCLAVDRGNEHVAYLYEPLHPAVLQVLQLVSRAAAEGGIAVGICGEMAGDPLYSLVLLGLGFRDLSMNSSCMPRVKRVIRNVRHSDAVELTARLLLLGTGREVLSCLEEEMEARFPGILNGGIV